MKAKMCCHICRRHAGAIRGVQLENNRSPDDPHIFLLSDIDQSKTKENVFLVRSDNWMGDIKRIIADHGIHSYRKDAVLLIDTIYSASKSFFLDNDRGTSIDYFKDCLEFHKAEFGNVLNGVIHFDEATPHLHVVSVPIVERETGFALCAKELIGGKHRLYTLHDHLYLDIGIRYDLERGDRSDSKSKKTHMDMWKYKLFCLEEKISVAYNDLEQIKADVDRFGDMKNLFSWATEIANKVDDMVALIGATYTVERVQEDIETRDILLENKITDSGCRIEETPDNKYCYISGTDGNAISWDNKIPLFVQDGVRLIPSAWVLNGDEMVPWSDTDINVDCRDHVDDSPVEVLDKITDELDNLIATIDQNSDFEHYKDNVDIQED